MGDGNEVREQNVKIESGNTLQIIEFLNTLAFAASHDLVILIDG
jgi:hypothetical protein